ncbi:MAG TPA: alpha/beta fold hydrolase [Vicinamibacterales bacterium]|jgi:pimeloyl-ACP methyl ester carboxylesterase
MAHVDVDGTPIYWDERGRGEPLLLIMGLGAPSDSWHRVAPVLAEHYRVILFDNRGVGRSGVPPGPYAIATMAADAAAVLDAAGVESAHVFGASMGGYIAQELMLGHPTRVRSLILGCTSCGGRDAVIAANEVRSTLAAVATMPREQGRRAMAPFIYAPDTSAARIQEDLAITLAATFSAEGYVAQLQGIRAWPGTFSRLKGILVPTLVIHGECDALVPPENGRILAREIPGARLVMLPSASHLFMTDQPEPSMAAVRSFLADAAAGGIATHLSSRGGS